MKLYYVTLYFLLATFTSSAQKNAVHLELLGNTGYAAIGYERQFIQYNQLKINAETGIGSYRFLDYNNRFNPDIAISVLVKFYYALHPKHKLLGGTGIIWSNYTDGDPDLNPIKTSILYWNTNWGYAFEWSKKIQLQAYYITLKSHRWAHWLGFKIAYKW